MIKKRVVTPGEEIAIIEEFISSRNTYTVDGRIISKVVGLAEFDLEEKIAEVKPFKIPVLPRKNDIVHAQVSKLKDYVASLDIFFLEILNKYFYPSLSATLHVMNVSTSYVKTLYDVLGYGDIVRAKILVGSNPPYILSLRGRDFGVIYSNCPYCMTPLRKKGISLICTKCKRKVKRKISKKYYLLT